MNRRQLTIALSVLLFPVLLWAASRVVSPGGTPAGEAHPAPRPAAAVPRGPEAQVPQDVQLLLEQERYWRAARRLREVTTPRSDPGLLVVAAKAEAGWGGWDNVRQLLEGKPWLDTAVGGDGWYLLGRAREEAGRWPEAAAAYGRYLQVRRDTAALDGERAVAELRHGLALLRSGRTDEGVRALEAMRERAPSASGWVSLLAAEALVERGDTARVRALLDYRGGVESPLRAQRARIRAYRAANDVRGARALAASFRERAGADSAARAEFGVEAARAALQLGDTAAARQDLRAVVTDASALPTAGAVEAARLLSSLSGLSAGDRLAVALVYDRHGNAARAADGYRAWLAAGGGSPAQQQEVRLRLGRALFAAGRYAEVAAAVAPLLGAAPEAAAEATFLTGRAQYRRGQRAEAQATFLRGASRFPGTGAGGEALYLAADIRHDAGDVAGARALYRRTATEFPASPKAGLALMRLGGLAFGARDHAGAARVYDEYRARYPTGPYWLQATYWAGRALSAAGQADAARARWREVRAREPISYYSVLSAKRLGEAFWPIALGEAPADDAGARGRVERWARGIDVLRAAGLHVEAEAEAERRIREAGDDAALLYPLAEALGERGYAPQAIRVGQALRRGGGPYNVRLLRIMHPFPYRPMIAAEARERGLDPFLVAALVRQESSFKARAVSRVGARGLMQVMPETGRGLAAGVGIRDWSTELLFTPEINVHLGIRFLAAQMRRYGGSLPSVFSAYNAGPGRVERWKNFPEYRDEELFTERIPFEETRDYVKILTRNMAVYRGLYGG